MKHKTKYNLFKINFYLHNENKCKQQYGRKTRILCIIKSWTECDKEINLFKCIMDLNTIHQGPVVQSIISLTSSLRGQHIKHFTTLLPITLLFFVEKNEISFCNAFVTKKLAYFRY